MKISNFKAKILHYPLYIIFLLSLISFFLVSCGAFKPKKVDLRKIPGDPKLKRQKNIREGRGFRLMGLVDGKKVAEGTSNSHHQMKCGVHH